MHYIGVGVIHLIMVWINHASIIKTHTTGTTVHGMASTTVHGMASTTVHEMGIPISLQFLLHPHFLLSLLHSCCPVITIYVLHLHSRNFSLLYLFLFLLLFFHLLLHLRLILLILLTLLTPSTLSTLLVTLILGHLHLIKNRHTLLDLLDAAHHFILVNLHFYGVHGGQLPHVFVQSLPDPLVFFLPLPGIEVSQTLDQLIGACTKQCLFSLQALVVGLNICFQLAIILFEGVFVVGDFPFHTSFDLIED